MSISASGAKEEGKQQQGDGKEEDAAAGYGQFPVWLLSRRSLLKPPCFDSRVPAAFSNPRACCLVGAGPPAASCSRTALWSISLKKVTRSIPCVWEPTALPAYCVVVCAVRTFRGVVWQSRKLVVLHFAGIRCVMNLEDVDSLLAALPPQRCVRCPTFPGFCRAHVSHALAVRSLPHRCLGCPLFLPFDWAQIRGPRARVRAGPPAAAAAAAGTLPGLRRFSLTFRAHHSCSVAYDLSVCRLLASCFMVIRALP